MKTGKFATKFRLQPTKTDGRMLTVNDTGIRIVLIPFFGIAIPLITGMIHQAEFSHWQFKLAYLYTILIAFVVWHGNRYLLFSLRAYFDWFNKPVRKVSILLLSITIFTIPVTILLLLGWYQIFRPGHTDWQIIYTNTLIIMICVIFITHVYETVFLVKESESEMVRNEQLERAKAEAELEALKNQVSPHFIFNSLNTLSFLIEDNPVKAKLFNDNLAEVYRYILQNRTGNLVLLRDELEFLQLYFSLLKIRFGEALQLEIEISEMLLQNCLVTPISLQVLVENAIKHNNFSPQEPLVLTIRAKGDEIRISNRINRKLLSRPSPKTGLYNLNERYKLIAEKEIQVEEDGDQFRVSLPLLKISN